MTKQEPIAWAVIDSKENVVELAKTRLALEHDHIRQDDQIKKLYLSKPTTLTKEEIEALDTAIKMWLVSPQAESVSKVIQNLLERMNNNEQSEQMEIAREIMKQDRECLRNLSKNNDDSIKNFDS